MFTAIVTYDLKTLRSVLASRRLFRTALRTTLWGHHVALVKDLLFLFGEKESLFALNARCFDVRHIGFSLKYSEQAGYANHSTHKRNGHANR